MRAKTEHGKMASARAPMINLPRVPGPVVSVRYTTLTARARLLGYLRRL
jgi:hypothetical protein